MVLRAGVAQVTSWKTRLVLHWIPSSAGHPSSCGSDAKSTTRKERVIMADSFLVRLPKGMDLLEAIAEEFRKRSISKASFSLV